MQFWGKLIGAFFGYLLAGPVGALLGLFAGAVFDRGFRSTWQFPYAHLNPNQLHDTQKAFFKATFTIMGHIAKADGRVSEDEIRIARSIMQRMRLTDSQKQQAIRYFTSGKQKNFSLETALSELMSACHQQRMLLRMFIEIQYQAANVDGLPATGKKATILDTICQRFGFANIFGTGFKQQYQQQSRNNYQQARRPVNSLRDAYATLNISNSATNSEVKRAYRKQMSQHHPDKLIAQGLPEEMIKLATDKTQKIQAAYEQIRESRGL